ncbi:succinyl-diaminopimelate desuccinylase [Dietzia sp.]|uniref:succinyl-diaminopimelate desuccinylase n=1 Tax=Dietzia sp. TaxID=1871616 RepID=UPI002FDA3F1D
MSTREGSTPSTSNDGAPALDLAGAPVALTAALVDIESPSREEEALADAVEAALRASVAAFRGPGTSTDVERIGNCVVARTNRGLGSRVILAGHLDTVPVADNVPSVVRHVPRDGDCDGGEPEERMYGCGTSDMKSGDAVFLHLFDALADAEELAHDLTIIMYDCEEIEASANGLGVLQRERPELLDGDLAILGEPTDGFIEAGCQGTLRIRVHAVGTRAHSARSWLGENAIHRLAPVLGALSEYTPRDVEIDGCTYREGLQAVRVSGGVAGNVVPDSAWVDVNFRFAPDLSSGEALHHAVEALGLAPGSRFDAADPWSEEVSEPLADRSGEGQGGHDGGPSEPQADPISWQLTDLSPAAMPGLSIPAAAALVRAAGGRVRAKYGWTDVSRFAAAGVAAVNLGPGDPGTAHKRDEFCRTAEIGEVAAFLRGFLTAPGE